MGKKRKHHKSKHSGRQVEVPCEPETHAEEQDPEKDNVEQPPHEQVEEETPAQVEPEIEAQPEPEPENETEVAPDPKFKSHGKRDQTFRDPEHKKKKFKPAFRRISVDPARKYQQPEERESWGPNVKGKKFRKEKGKKKRCPNAGVRIDGSVKSIRLDA